MEGKREGNFTAGKDGRTDIEPVDSHTEIAIIKNQSGQNGISNLVGDREKELKKGMNERVSFLGGSASAMSQDTLIASIANKVKEVIHKPSTLTFSADMPEAERRKAVEQEKIKTLNSSLPPLLATLTHYEQTLEYQARFKDNNNDNIEANLDCLNQVMAVVLNSLLGKTNEELDEYKVFFSLCQHVISNIEAQREPMFFRAAEKREALARVIDEREAELARAYAELERLSTAERVVAPKAKSASDKLKEKAASGKKRARAEVADLSSSSAEQKQPVFTASSTIDALGDFDDSIYS